MRIRAACAAAVAVTALVAGCDSSSSTTHASGVTTTRLASVGAADSHALQAAAHVLQRRLAWFDKGAVVTTNGDQLVVRASRRATSALPALLVPGRLEMRRVVETEPVDPAPSGTGAGSPRSGDPFTPAAFLALDCSGSSSRGSGAVAAPGREVVACDDQGREKLHLAVAEVLGGDVQGAKVKSDQLGTQVVVILHFTREGQRRFTGLTREAFGAVPPTNRVAILVDGVALTSPTIQSVIEGDAEITGGFTVAQADALASVLSYQPLATRLVVAG